jgi:hypothetical protein
MDLRGIDGHLYGLRSRRLSDYADRVPYKVHRYFCHEDGAAFLAYIMSPGLVLT